MNGTTRPEAAQEIYAAALNVFRKGAFSVSPPTYTAKLKKAFNLISLVVA